MRKILIDARWLTNSVRGIGVFTKNLIQALIKINHAEFEFHLAVRKKYLSSLSSELPNNFRVVQIPDWYPDPILDLLFFNFLAWKVSADVVHFTGNTGFILPSLKARVLLTLHDVSFLKGTDVVPFPHQNLRQAIGRIYRKLFVPFYAKMASKVFTVSEFAVKDILNELGITSEFIYHGFDLPVPANVLGQRGEDAESGKSGKSGKSKYLVITGGDPQKNLSLAVSAFIALYRKYKSDAPELTVIGVTQAQYERLNPAIALTENILFLGILPHREIPSYIRCCKALIIPSFYESFGLPVVESLSLYKAPLCSSSGALPEIGSEFAHYFDPRDTDTLVNLIEMVEKDTLPIDLSAEQVDHYLERFRWSRVANFYLYQYGPHKLTLNREVPVS